MNRDPIWQVTSCSSEVEFPQEELYRPLPLPLLCTSRLEGQILARFEEENGGRLLIATLCLLEVSARGLLEIELLSILGDEENSLPPGDVSDLEKDDEESAGKSELNVTLHYQSGNLDFYSGLSSKNYR